MSTDDPEVPFIPVPDTSAGNPRDGVFAWAVLFLLLAIVSFVTWFIVNESEEAESQRKAWIAYCEKNGWSYYGALRVENPRGRFEACQAPSGALHLIPEKTKP